MNEMKNSFRFLIIIGALSLLLLFCLSFSYQEKGKETITENEAKALWGQYLKARNEANLDILDDVFDPEVVVHDCGAPEDIVGLEALKNYYKNNHAAFPDLKMTIGKMIVKDDMIVGFWTFSGTNTGIFHTPFGDIPPTGKKVTFSGIAVDRVANGKVVEEWVFFSLLVPLQQLGFTLNPPQIQQPE
jgi:predicted ester cyclase